jgi:hypothetical protein
VREMYDLKKWIEDDERVIYELECLLKNLDVTIGNMGKLRNAVDSFIPVERKQNE